MRTDVVYVWRGDVTDAEVVALTRSLRGRAQVGWWDRIRPFSRGWVTARLRSGEAVGFVNVAWDGGDHAFLIDTKVRGDLQRLGIGSELVAVAVENARLAGCEWLHVDYEQDLESFYVGACRFRPTPAALAHLRERA